MVMSAQDAPVAASDDSTKAAVISSLRTIVSSHCRIRPLSRASLRWAAARLLGASDQLNRHSPNSRRIHRHFWSFCLRLAVQATQSRSRRNRKKRLKIFSKGIEQTSLHLKSKAPSSPEWRSLQSRRARRRAPRAAACPDDCNIYVRSRRAGERVMASVSRLLTTKLRLKVNEAKSAVARPEERKFLGFSISNDGSERRIAPKALDKFKAQFQDMTLRTRGPVCN